MSESERPDEPSAGEVVPAAGEPGTSEPPPEPPPQAEPGPKRLLRSRDDRVLAGVCGGVGEYLGVDAVLVRIAALVLIFAGGAGLILYVIGWLAMPEPPEDAARVTTAPSATRADEPTTGAVVLGAMLVLIGAFFLLDEAFPDFLSWNWIWPIVLIAVGAVVILRARR